MTLKDFFSHPLTVAAITAAVTVVFTVYGMSLAYGERIQAIKEKVAVMDSTIQSSIKDSENALHRRFDTLEPRVTWAANVIFKNHPNESVPLFVISPASLRLPESQQYELAAKLKTVALKDWGDVFSTYSIGRTGYVSDWGWNIPDSPSIPATKLVWKKPKLDLDKLKDDVMKR